MGKTRRGAFLSAVVALVRMTLFQLFPAAQAAATPQTFTIEVGRELGLMGSHGLRSDR